jgi:hypothetical protein
MTQERFKREALGRVEDFDAYLVNGQEVRAHLDPDFDGGSYVDCEFIPAGELWVDDSACGLGDYAEVEEALNSQVAKARQKVAVMSDEELVDALSKDYEPVV